MKEQSSHLLRFQIWAPPLLLDVREVGYFKVFRAMLAEYGERWRVYGTVRCKLPLDDEATALDGFAISSSCSLQRHP